MKTTVLILSILALVSAGCLSKNPGYTAIAPGQPDTNTVPQYIPDPRIAGLSNTVGGVITVTKPFNPYGSITEAASNGFFWLVGGVSAVIAAWQSKRKSDALNALGTMASGVVNAGTGVASAVLNHASETDHFAGVATAINNATAAGKPLI